ncbi:MAG: FHA domain-containing protein [Candidatus Lernaella stagnicola]|nr:FHA domain-containing protein [Candidatus Lernaella stagnicola]
MSDSLILRRLRENFQDAESGLRWRLRGILHIAFVLFFLAFTFIFMVCANNYVTVLYPTLLVLIGLSVAIRRFLGEAQFYVWPIVSFFLMMFAYFTSSNDFISSVLYNASFFMLILPERWFDALWFLGYLILLLIVSFIFTMYGAGDHAFLLVPLVANALFMPAWFLINFLFHQERSKRPPSPFSDAISVPPALPPRPHKIPTARPLAPAADEQTTRSVTASPDDATKIIAVRQLEVVEGPDAGLVFGLDSGEHLIGRSTDCKFVLRDAMVSKAHGRFSVTGQSFSYMDVGSSNGSYLNERAIEQTELNVGDVLRIGTTKIKVTRR